LEFIVGKCLAKDREDRPATAQEVARELRTLSDKLKSGRSKIVQKSPTTGESPTTWGLTPLPADGLPPDSVVISRSRQRALHAVAAVATLAFLAVAAVYFTQARLGELPQQGLPTVDLSTPLPEGMQAREIILSPDGRYLAMAADPNRSLWVRPLDSDGWRELTGSSGGAYPFWSPDSAQIGFFASGSLKKVALAGGPPETITDQVDVSPRGGSWGPAGTILFAPNPVGRIFSVPESGGDPMPVTAAPKIGGGNQRYPHFLPDGRHFLYTSADSAPDLAGIYLASLDGEAPRRLVPDISNAIYAPRARQTETGFLLFVRGGALIAQPFDPARLELSGTPIELPAAPPDLQYYLYGFTASHSGVLAHSTSGPPSHTRLVWVDRAGAAVDRTDVVHDSIGAPRLSPDGRHVAYSGATGVNNFVWIYDFNLRTRTLLSSSFGVPVWSPDGAQVAFSERRSATNFDILVRPSDGSSPAVDVLSTTAVEQPADWSRDGRYIVYATSQDIGYLERTGAQGDWEPHSFLNSAAGEGNARLSPDGRWVAYRSNASGRNEIYVQSFPEGGRRTTVSAAGGSAPAWSRDGRELFYVDPHETLIAVDVSTVGEFTINEVTSLFQFARGRFDVSLDGQRFLVQELVNADGEPSVPTESSIRVITGWPAKFAPEQ
jgi:Tol biopolymer transport system component